MATVEHLREFVNERLAAAAEEIFGVFKKTVVELESEIERQRVLLDVAWKPEVKLHRIEPDVVTHEEPGTHQRSPSPDRDEPEPLQIKVEPEEVCSSLAGEPFVLKQEDEAIDSNPPCDVSELSPLASESGPSKDEEDCHQDAKFILSESDPKLHTCKVCGETFAYKSHLTIHLRIHPDAKPFTCSFCGKRFRYESSLPKHIRIHTGQRPYSCKTCGKTFSDNSQYHVHMRIHTGEKPYSCNICQKKFASSSQWKIHMRMHTGERPYPCVTCGKRFSQLGAVKHHMRSQICDRTFSCGVRKSSQKPNSNAHLRAPRCEKPHCCSVCGEGFARTSAMMQHLHTHMLKKPYCCNTCGKRYSAASSMQRHINAQHAN